MDQLRCEVVHPPCVSERIGSGPDVLVIENHHTFVSLCQTLPRDGNVGVVVYGAGTHFKGSVAFLADLQPPPRRALYFGDLDVNGLDVPAHASAVAVAAGLPDIEPAILLFRLLLEHGGFRSWSSWRTGDAWRAVIKFVMISSRTLWRAALLAVVLVGVGLAVWNPPNGSWPRHLGVYIAALAWVGGVAFGLRGAWLPFAGIATFGLAAFVVETVNPSGGEDQRALVVLYLTVIPALFAVPAFVGVGMRHLVRRRPSARTFGDAPHPDA